MLLHPVFPGVNLSSREVKVLRGGWWLVGTHELGMDLMF